MTTTPSIRSGKRHRPSEGTGESTWPMLEPATHRHRFLVRCQNFPGPPAVGVDDQGEGLLTVDVDLERAGGCCGSGIDETARPGTQSGGYPCGSI